MRKAVFISIFVFLYAGIVFAAESTKVKIMAVNPSPTESIKTTIREVLPPEVTPDDVLDKSVVKVEYNREKKCYEVVADISLAPKESKTIIVPVRNVWTLSEEELAETKKQIDDSVAALEGTKFYDTGQALSTKLTDRLSQVEAVKVKDLSMRQRIEVYRAQKKELEEIRNQAVSFGAIRRVQEEQEFGLRTAKFIITATNSANEKKTLTVRSPLPRDVTADVILDKLDFNLLYDKDDNRFILEKDVEFQPGETKKYEITLRDIWFIPQTDLDFLKAQTEKLMEHFQDTMFERYATNVASYIFDSLKSIQELQNDTQGAAVEDRIRAFVLNSERIELIKKKLKELQDLLLEIPLKKSQSPMDELKRAIREFQKTLGKILSMGFQPNLATTWWIILGIIGFLFAMSVSFYVTWITRLGRAKWGKKAGAVKKGPKENPENTETKTEGS